MALLRRISERIKLDQGMTIEWSGQYENQIRAKERLELVRGHTRRRESSPV